ncbi:hypothetical protein F1880_010315 [Penicillium rolfsii]|nr:hypothetical protein F1880_010315 [Penicillium rolfsii]
MGASAPASIIACNLAFGTCQQACASVCWHRHCENCEIGKPFLRRIANRPLTKNTIFCKGPVIRQSNSFWKFDGRSSL